MPHFVTDKKEIHPHKEVLKLLPFRVDDLKTTYIGLNEQRDYMIKLSCAAYGDIFTVDFVLKTAFIKLANKIIEERNHINRIEKKKTITGKIIQYEFIPETPPK